MSGEQPPPKRDLVILVADENQRSGLEALLQRGRSLEIRAISFEIFVHPWRDPGVLNGAHEFLLPFTRQYGYAMILFDREGCGRTEPAAALQDEVQRRLDRVGWEGRSAVIVLEPELEVWVWSGSRHVPKVLGLDKGPLDSLLRSKYDFGPYDKPKHPKEAMEDALRQSNTPRSSSIYRHLAEKVSLTRCKDPSFRGFTETLRRWFPIV